MLRFLLGLLVALPGLAWAQAGCGVGFGNAGGRLTYTSNGGQVTALPRITDSAFRQAWGGTFEMAGSTVRASGQVAAAVGTGVAAATACMTASRSLSLSAVARGAARAVPVVGTGILLVDIANTIRCRGANSSVLYGAGLECDPGEAPVTTTGTVYLANQVPSGHPLRGPHSSPTLAAEAYLQYRNADEGYARFGPLCQWETYSWGYLVGAQVRDSSGNVTNECLAQHASVENTTGTIQTCPYDGSTLGGRPFCPTGTWTPATTDFVADRIAANPQFQANADDVASEAAQRGHDFTDDAGSPELSGPASVNGPTTTTTTTTGSGSPSTRTQTPQHGITYSGDSYTYNTTITTIEGDTTTVTNQAPEINMCGLPGTPPCKIDESGTPDAGTRNPQADVDGALSRAKQIAEGDLGMPTLPEINWSFSLPSSCGVIPLAAFAPFITEIDVCQFQPVFHDLMGVVWVLGALLGAISVFWRDQLAA